MRESLLLGVIAAIRTFGDRMNLHPHLERLFFLESGGKVGYRYGEKGAEQETMDYLEFIARVTSPIPDKGQVTGPRLAVLMASMRAALPCLRAGRARGGRFGLYSCKRVDGSMNAVEGGRE